MGLTWRFWRTDYNPTFKPKYYPNILGLQSNSSFHQWRNRLLWLQNHRTSPQEQIQAWCDQRTFRYSVMHHRPSLHMTNHPPPSTKALFRGFWGDPTPSQGGQVPKEGARISKPPSLGLGFPTTIGSKKKKPVPVKEKTQNPNKVGRKTSGFHRKQYPINGILSDKSRKPKKQQI